MNKKGITIFIVVVFVMIGSIWGIKKINSTGTGTAATQKTSYPDAVKVEIWNGSAKSYRVVETEAEDKITNLWFECAAAFSSKLSKEDMIKTNPEDYIGEITFYSYIFSDNASLFFHKDNYFVLYYDKQNECYRVENCCSINRLMDDDIIYLPTPVILSLDAEAFPMYNEFNKNVLDILYDHYTYEQACEFYRRLPRYSEMDDSKKRIHVSGYYKHKDVLLKDIIIFDFKNRTVLAKNKKGKWTTYDGKE